SINGASLPRSVGSSATPAASSSNIANLVSMSQRFSKEKSLAICRSCSQPKLNWSSISRPQKPLPSLYRPRCSPVPTRSSSEQFLFQTFSQMLRTVGTYLPSLLLLGNGALG